MRYLNMTAASADPPRSPLAPGASSAGSTLAFDRVTRDFIAPAGATYRFSYLAASYTLASITFPDAAIRTFIYNEPANTSGANLPNALTGIVDENNARFATFQYDARERALSSEHAGGAQRYTLSYAAGSTGSPRSSSRVRLARSPVFVVA